MIRALLHSKASLAGVLLIGTLAFSGCNFFGGPVPANAHLGDNGTTTIGLSGYPNEVDVTLDNPVSKWWVQTYVNCGGRGHEICLQGAVSQLTAGTADQQGAINAAGDVGFQAGIGQLAPYGDEWNAAVEYTWAGDGPDHNCIGFHATTDEQFVTPSNPPTAQASATGSWYTIWPLNPYGWNGDGGGQCNL